MEKEVEMQLRSVVNNITALCSQYIFPDKDLSAQEMILCACLLENTGKLIKELMKE